MLRARCTLRLDALCVAGAKSAARRYTWRECSFSGYCVSVVEGRSGRRRRVGFLDGLKLSLARRLRARALRQDFRAGRLDCVLVMPRVWPIHLLLLASFLVCGTLWTIRQSERLVGDPIVDALLPAAWWPVYYATSALTFLMLPLMFAMPALMDWRYVVSRLRRPRVLRVRLTSTHLHAELSDGSERVHRWSDMRSVGPSWVEFDRESHAKYEFTRMTPAEWRLVYLALHRGRCVDGHHVRRRLTRAVVWLLLGAIGADCIALAVTRSLGVGVTPGAITLMALAVGGCVWLQAQIKKWEARGFRWGHVRRCRRRS
ncbi:hypothetical protein RAS1_37700 [Phycisphaerae bacterium RAS1]|nr:hypothetical protein RAS1_37700 [Phycisphaerae bacterium RAS1]